MKGRERLSLAKKGTGLIERVSRSSVSSRVKKGRPHRDLHPAQTFADLLNGDDRPHSRKSGITSAAHRATGRPSFPPEDPCTLLSRGPCDHQGPLKILYKKFRSGRYPARVLAQFLPGTERAARNRSNRLAGMNQSTQLSLPSMQLSETTLTAFRPYVSGFAGSAPPPELPNSTRRPSLPHDNPLAALPPPSEWPEPRYPPPGHVFLTGGDYDPSSPRFYARISQPSVQPRRNGPSKVDPFAPPTPRLGRPPIWEQQERLSHPSYASESAYTFPATTTSGPPGRPPPMQSHPPQHRPGSSGGERRGSGGMVETIIARAQGDRPQPAQDLIAPSSIGGSHGASYEREGSTLDGSDGTPPPPQGPSSSGPVRKRNDRTDDPSRRHHCTHPGCGKAFTTSGHLSRHHRVHTCEKRYPCLDPDCEARFSRQDNMLQHYKGHVNGKIPRRTAETASGVVAAQSGGRRAPPRKTSDPGPPGSFDPSSTASGPPAFPSAPSFDSYIDPLPARRDPWGLEDPARLQYSGSNHPERGHLREQSYVDLPTAHGIHTDRNGNIMRPMRPGQPPPGPSQWVVQEVPPLPRRQPAQHLQAYFGAMTRQSPSYGKIIGRGPPSSDAMHDTPQQAEYGSTSASLPPPPAIGFDGMNPTAHSSVAPYPDGPLPPPPERFVGLDRALPPRSSLPSLPPPFPVPGPSLAPPSGPQTLEHAPSLASLMDEGREADDRTDTPANRYAGFAMALERRGSRTRVEAPDSDVRGALERESSPASLPDVGASKAEVEARKETEAEAGAGETMVVDAVA